MLARDQLTDKWSTRWRRDIRAGRLRPGDRLPPQRDLASAIGVTVGTVTRAYQLAARQGLVGGEIGRGTYVRPLPRAGRCDAARSLAERAATARACRGAGGTPRDRRRRQSCGAARIPAACRPLGASRRGRRLDRVAGRCAVAPSQVLVTVGAQHALAIALATIGHAGAPTAGRGAHLRGHRRRRRACSAFPSCR